MLPLFKLQQVLRQDMEKLLRIKEQRKTYLNELLTKVGLRLFHSERIARILRTNARTRLLFLPSFSSNNTSAGT